MRRGILLLAILFFLSFSVVSAANLTQKFDYCYYLNYSYETCFNFWGFAENQTIINNVIVNGSQNCTSNVTFYYPIYVNNTIVQNETIYVDNQTCDLTRLTLDYDQQYRMAALSKGCLQWCEENYEKCEPLPCPNITCETCDYSGMINNTACDLKISEQIALRCPIEKDDDKSAIKGVPDWVLISFFLIIIGVLASIKLGWFKGSRGSSEPVVINVPARPAVSQFKEQPQHDQKSDALPPGL